MTVTKDCERNHWRRFTISKTD